MFITSKKDVEQPVTNPWGEIVYELVDAETHSVAVVVIPPQKSSALHYHEVSEETYYILRGSARLVVDDQSFSLTPGQACLIQPEERHQIFNAGEKDLEFIVVCAPPWSPDDSLFVHHLQRL